MAKKKEQPIEITPVQPLEGQTAFPGFDEPEATTKRNPILNIDAETVKQNIGRVSFRVEYIKSPEDALIAWGAPKEALQDYLKQHHKDLVQRAANEMLADPKQIEDLARRTPEQQRKLHEIAARESLARINVFFRTRWYNALTMLSNLPTSFKVSTATGGQEEDGYLPIDAQAALYYFAVHQEIDPEATNPTETAELTEEQKAELIEVFKGLDSFCCALEKANRRPLTADEVSSTVYSFVDLWHKPRKSKFSQAEETGAVMSIGDRLFLPTDPEYQTAFMTSIRATAGFFRKDPETGTRQLATNVNTAFLQALGKSVLVDIYNGKQGDTSVYFPYFARELGLDLNWKTNPGKGESAQEVQKLTTSRAEARAAFINKKLAEWDSIWGVLPRSGAKEYKLMALHTYDPETEVFTFQSPYLQELVNGLIRKEESEIDKGKHYYLWQSDLLHATAANEKNPAAVEMAARILQGVQQRGMKPDAKLKQNKNRAFLDESEVTFSISCANLVQECPQIRERLKSKPNASRKTQELKRSFTAMYKILQRKSDLFTYYKDLTITEVIPTAKSLNATITISHHGGNPDYKKPFLPLKEDPAPEGPD